MSKAGIKGCAVCECLQEIPCNPCVSACKVGAITMESLTSLPHIDESKCIGCKTCVAACSGQAIFFIAEDSDCDAAYITFPYEYLPLPKEGQIVTAVDRMGQPVCEAVTETVEKRKAFNKTVLVTLKGPSEFKDEVRFMKRLER